MRGGRWQLSSVTASEFDSWQESKRISLEGYGKSSGLYLFLQQGFLWGLFPAFPDQTLLSGVVSLLLSFACIAEILASVIWAKLNTRLFQSVKYVQSFRERERYGENIFFVWLLHTNGKAFHGMCCKGWNKEPFSKFLYSPISMSFSSQTLKDVIKSTHILFFLLPMMYSSICILHIRILPSYKHLKIHIYCIFLHFSTYFLCWPFGFFPHRACSIHPWKQCSVIFLSPWFLFPILSRDSFRKDRFLPICPPLKACFV